MALLGRDSVGDVGKGGGALVGGDDEIGVIAIVPHGVVGRHDCVTVEIIGEFEQRANEDAIGFSAFRHPGIAIGGRRQAFGHEAAFGADRHDDGVLDLLCLNQTQDLGAKILRPVGPAQAAARHLAEAQMNAFDTRRIDENLVKRPRRRQVLDLARFEFERDHRTRMPVLADLPQIGADGGLHQIGEKAQDAVFVERGDGFELLLNLGENGRLACRALGAGRDEVRVEAGLEQRDNAGGDRGVVAQSLPHIVLAEWRADLAQVAGEGPDGRNFAPAQGCPQNEGVVPVGFGAIAHHHHDRGFQAMVEFRADNDRLAVVGLDRHIVQPHRRGCRRRAGHDLIGAFVDDAQAMIFDHRHPVGQRQGRAAREDLEAEARRIVLILDAVDRNRHRTSRGEFFDDRDIGSRL